MLKVVHDEAEPDEASGSLLDETVRDAVRQMLAVALKAEVAAYIDAGTVTARSSSTEGTWDATFEPDRVLSFAAVLRFIGWLPGGVGWRRRS